MIRYAKFICVTYASVSICIYIRTELVVEFILQKAQSSCKKNDNKDVVWLRKKKDNEEDVWNKNFLQVHHSPVLYQSRVHYTP